MVRVWFVIMVWVEIVIMVNAEIVNGRSVEVCCNTLPGGHILHLVGMPYSI